MGADRQHLGVVAAAVVQKVGNRPPDPRRIDAVDHVPRLLARLQQAGLLQRGKVERQARCRKPKRLRYPARRHTSRSKRHEKPDQIQPCLMCQCPKGRKDFTLFHRSTIQEWLK
jgi:hypothetical protein